MLAGKIWFWENFKISFALDWHIQEKKRIKISVQHQDDCIVVGQRLCYSDNDKNEVYVKIIDDFYVIGGGT